MRFDEEEVGYMEYPVAVGVVVVAVVDGDG